MKRRQAAVVFNDISGYTSLMQSNEEKAILIRQRHKEVVDRLTRQHKGTIIQYYGDGTLSIFDHSIDAVQCALSMQLEFKKSPEIPLRIGINAGDILLGPDGIYGDSVNIASRIERMSLPGSVLISSRVFNDIKDHQHIQTKDLGQFELKNVKSPVNIYAVTNEGICVPEPQDLSGKVGYKEKSIIVLPFYNLSKDPDNDALTDGITEQIIYTLSEIEGLRVTSRTSSFMFKDKQVNLRQLHQDLGLDNVLEGSVRRQGKKVRITAQLINAADDFQLWSETYTRELCDVFQLQDEIASMISNKLKAGFQQSYHKRIAIPEEESDNRADMYEHYHKGRYDWKQMQPGYIDKAIHSFKRALETDQDFYPPWPALAKAYAYKGFFNLMPPAEASRLCFESLQHAQKLDPHHIQTLNSSALHHLFFKWDIESAGKYLDEAANAKDQDNFMLNNSVHHISALYHLAKNNPQQAIHLLRKALKLDPLNILMQMDLAQALQFNREFKKALDTISNIIRLRPDYLPAYERKGWILFDLGHQRESIESFDFYRTHSSFPAAGLAGLSYVYARTLQAQQATEMKERIMAISADVHTVMHIDLAISHLGAQEYQDMFKQLRLAVDAGMPSMIFIDADPLWNEIRRFNEYRDLKNAINDPQIAYSPPL